MDPCEWTCVRTFQECWDCRWPPHLGIAHGLDLMCMVLKIGWMLNLNLRRKLSTEKIGDLDVFIKTVEMKDFWFLVLTHSVLWAVIFNPQCFCIPSIFCRLSTFKSHTLIYIVCVVKIIGIWNTCKIHTHSSPSLQYLYRHRGIFFTITLLWLCENQHPSVKDLFI